MGVDLADMQVISILRNFVFYYVLLICKYAWFVPLKDKIGITVTVFQKF